MNKEANKLFEYYKKSLGDKKYHLYFSPGRVNLIGEYTDFNEGLVMPCALQLGTYLIVTENTEGEFNFNSINLDQQLNLNTSQLLSLKVSDSRYDWINYPLGVLKQFDLKSLNGKGLDFYFYGNIPIGSGLSSSASIEVATAFALNDLLQCELSLTELAHIAQRAEGEFVGVSCGIMDQFVIAHGKQDQALLLNCDDLSFQYVPCQFKEHQWLIINSGKSRALAESKYNERRLQCETLLNLINQHYAPANLPIKNLCQLHPDQLESIQEHISDPLLFSKLKHTVIENHSVLAFQKALQVKNFELAGQLMNASHQSLKTDYQVTGEALDTLVEIAQSFPEVLGARMTGAGFGGCTINLVKTNNIDKLYQDISGRYQSAQPYQTQMILAQPSNGVRKLN